MYIISVTFLLLVIPIVSIVVEQVVFHTALTFLLIGKWFTFWSVGVRLLLAGLRQVKQPEYTAKEILGIKTNEVNIVVRELGFANISSGILGISSLFLPAWLLPAALIGGLYYGLAGVQHILKKEKNSLEQFATYSDLIIALFLLIFFVSYLFS